uniref:Uncharacterized protein n=1 Tax=Timema poppense TaxID=170557 RepID=A0A7R9DV08_TIMPO|nr:unnamed protein product [Timema poppensis]
MQTNSNRGYTRSSKQPPTRATRTPQICKPRSRNTRRLKQRLRHTATPLWCWTTPAWR